MYAIIKGLDIIGVSESLQNSYGGPMGDSTFCQFVQMPENIKSEFGKVVNTATIPATWTDNFTKDDAQPVLESAIYFKNGQSFPECPIIPAHYTKNGQSLLAQPFIPLFWSKDESISPIQPLCISWVKDETVVFSQPMTHVHWVRDTKISHTQPMTPAFWTKDGEADSYTAQDTTWTYTPAAIDYSWKVVEPVADPEYTIDFYTIDPTWTKHDPEPDTSWVFVDEDFDYSFILHDVGALDPRFVFVPEHIIPVPAHIVIDEAKSAIWKAEQNQKARLAFGAAEDAKADAAIVSIKEVDMDDATVIMIAMGYMDVALNIAGDKTAEEIAAAKTALESFRAMRNAIQTARETRDAAKAAFVAPY